MTRPLTDVLRRGILSTLANWPVILTRVAESLVLFGAVVVAIIGCVVPLLVSAGIGAWELPATPTNAWEMMARIFAGKAEGVAICSAAEPDSPCAQTLPRPSSDEAASAR